RVELDFCALQARLFVGADAGAALTATVDLGDTAPFDSFYIAQGLRSTFIDDLAIWTRGTSIDRSMLCGAQLIETINSPGSRCSGIAWDGANLWMLDNLKTLYRIGDSAGVVANFQGYGLSWDAAGKGFWTRNNNSNSGAQIVRLYPNGTFDAGPNIFAQGGFTDANAQGQWYGGAFWTLAVSPSTIVQQWSTNGVQISNWVVSPPVFPGPVTTSGVLVSNNAVYVGAAIYLGSTDQDIGLMKFSLAG